MSPTRDAASPGLDRAPATGLVALLGFRSCAASHGSLPRVQTQNRADVPVCPGPCSAGTVTRQAGSLCILADAGALLSQGEVALVSPLPIARQLLSWPCSCSDGSLSCPVMLKRR